MCDAYHLGNGLARAEFLPQLQAVSHTGQRDQDEAKDVTMCEAGLENTAWTQWTDPHYLSELQRSRGTSVIVIAVDVQDLQVQNGGDRL